MKMEFRYAVKSAAGPIKDVPDLCENVLGVTLKDFNKALELKPNERYRESHVPKKDGSLRVVYNPHISIRKIQRKINSRIFNPEVEKGTQVGVVQWPSYIYGCIPTQYFRSNDGNLAEEPRDYIACARVHCLSQSILKIDISNFFNNIHIDLVKEIFQEFLSYPDSVASALADICCMGNHLVQGGLTSSYIASLALWDVEAELVRRLKRKGLRYTRLIDDITVSSTKKNFNFDFAKQIITAELHKKDLPVNDAKTEINYSSSKPLLVHGLRVNFKEPRLPSEEVSRIRASVHNVEQLASERHYRTIHPYRRDHNRCLGRVNKLKRLGHNQHKALFERLKKIEPLPSKLDIKRCEKMIDRLELDFNAGKSDTLWYWRRYNVASQRLVVLKRTFKHESERLRARLRKAKQNYDPDK